MVKGYSLFKEGMYVAMDEYWYSIKKQIDGLNLGKMRHSFHSFVLLPSSAKPQLQPQLAAAAQAG